MFYLFSKVNFICESFKNFQKHQNKMWAFPSPQLSHNISQNNCWEKRMRKLCKISKHCMSAKGGGGGGHLKQILLFNLIVKKRSKYTFSYVECTCNYDGAQNPPTPPEQTSNNTISLNNPILPILDQE